MLKPLEHDVTAGKTAGWTKRGLARVRVCGWTIRRAASCDRRTSAGER
jgi:hypothetical protein